MEGLKFIELFEEVFLKIDIVPSTNEKVISGLPSKLISPIFIDKGLELVGKSILELKLKFPLEVVFVNIENELLIKFATIISGFPSPFISSTITLPGSLPIVKSNLFEK